jgi:putative YhbY family RNA-binding protein
MPQFELTRDERLALKARAHALNPVVLLGTNGLTPAVLREIDRALTAHELIKVRVPGDDRAAREAIYAQVAENLSAACVAAIGKLAIFYRPLPEDDEPPPRRAPPRR